MAGTITVGISGVTRAFVNSFCDVAAMGWTLLWWPRRCDGQDCVHMRVEVR